jgi:hypothetical protein
MCPVLFYIFGSLFLIAIAPPYSKYTVRQYSYKNTLSFNQWILATMLTNANHDGKIIRLKSFIALSRDIFNIWFFRQTEPMGPCDSWANGVSNIGSYSRRYSTPTLNLILLPWGRQDHQWLFVCYTLALPAETLVFWLCAILHSPELKIKGFICDSVLCHLVWNASPKFSCRRRAMRHSG